jgi:hypothetical protein
LDARDGNIYWRAFFTLGCPLFGHLYWFGNWFDMASFGGQKGQEPSSLADLIDQYIYVFPYACRPFHYMVEFKEAFQ